MAELFFRDLRSDEIDCRVATISEKGLSLLLYKDARCDMNILDETVGAFNWQRSHCRDNANCVVSIWDSEKGQWISKEDVGTESNTDAVKGLASDSFKRACFNWGIGRELYTAPFIWVDAKDTNITKRNDGKFITYDKFAVSDITISDHKITSLTIINTKSGAVVYNYPMKKRTKTAQAKKETVDIVAPDNNRTKFKYYVLENKISNQVINDVIAACGLTDSSDDSEWENALMYLIALRGGTQV